MSWNAFNTLSAIPSIMDAAMHGDIFDILEALQLNPSEYASFPLNTMKNANGETVLMVASRTGQLEIVKGLVKTSDVDDIDSDGWSALLDASYHGYVEIVCALLEAGANVDQPDLMGWSPLMWSIYNNHAQCVEIFLGTGAHVSIVDEEDGLSPLIVAAARGYECIVELLIGYKAEVNACDKFGSTALIWASRKGYYGICEKLLMNGAEYDAVGMYSSTALILATRGNFIEVVDLLLRRDANVNIIDQNGLSALGIAAREGYAEIAEMLVHSGAYVNVADRFGYSILANAVRSGNAKIVRLLLDRHADVNTKYSENRTALHLAIDKGFMDIVLILLEKKPNLDLKNINGETALIRAVKNRHLGLVQLLVSNGAKVSSTDSSGDNALHIALRIRSKRITQSLLLNPSDSRLLYRPNRDGQTPYSIDQYNTNPILPLIFGPIETETHMDAMLGYNVYSNVLADIVCEPNLSLPLTIGLYAKWGSGKSLLLAKLKDSMHIFSRSWLDSLHITWSWSILLLIAVSTTLITLICLTASAYFMDVFVLSTIPIMGALVFLTFLFIYGIVYYGSQVKGWNGCYVIGRKIAKATAHFQLFMNMISTHTPLRREKEIITSPVSFLFADYHRLSSIGGEQALARIIINLFEAAEDHYGPLSVRICCSLDFEHPRSDLAKHRKFCGIPVRLLIAIFIFSVTTSFTLLTIVTYNRELSSKLALVSITVVSWTALVFAYFFSMFIYYVFINLPKKRISRAACMIPEIRFEGLMQKLQQEVDLLSMIIRVLDALTNSQIRLVIIVDGLDNCEQEKMVQTLDSLELLFSTRANRPFIVVIAVDPHVLVSAFNHSMHSALVGTELTGHDYLKNIINMPLYLHNSALRQLQKKLHERRESFAEWKERFRRQDTYHGSYMSLSGESKSKKVYRGTSSWDQTLLTDDYFSNMNPRAMKRIVNALTLTGRLMRAFEIDFSWLTLGFWVSLIEQWPSRMSWLIDRALDFQHSDHLSLAHVYNQLKHFIPKKDSLIDLDRNPDNFESFLEQASLGGLEQLTIGHVRQFVPCTSNLDPYLRKIIRERRIDIGVPLSSIDNAQITLNEVIRKPDSTIAKYLFKDCNTWSLIDIPLVEMKLGDIISLVKKLDIEPERLSSIEEKMCAENLNGLVLLVCDLARLERTLALSLGDWTLLKLLIENLRNLDISGGGYVTNSIMSKRTFHSPIKEEVKKRLASQSEVESDSHWLFESLSRLNALDSNTGGVVNSRSTSVKFDDEVASDKDSIASMYGSTEQLLESDEIMERSSSAREDRLKLIRTQSISSQCNNGELSRMSADSENIEQQLTVKRRFVEDKPSVHGVFDNNT